MKDHLLQRLIQSRKELLETYTEQHIRLVRKLNKDENLHQQLESFEHHTRNNMEPILNEIVKTTREIYEHTNKLINVEYGSQ